MILKACRSALASSTSTVLPPPADTKVYASDLATRREHTISVETPHTITFADLNEMLDRADKQHAERRILTKAEQDEIWANRYRPIPTMEETRKAEYEALVEQLNTSGSLAEYCHWYEEVSFHAFMWGNGSGSPTGLFADWHGNGRGRHLTSRRK